MTALYTPEDARLLALAEKATPGPWTDRWRQGVTGETAARMLGVEKECGHIIRENVFFTTSSEPAGEHLGATARLTDAEFIAAANPAVIKSLIERLRAVDAACRELEVAAEA